MATGQMKWADDPKNPLNWPDTSIMASVRGGEGEVDSVYLRTNSARPQIVAINQGGFDLTEVDLLDVLDWADRNSRLVLRLREP